MHNLANFPSLSKDDYQIKILLHRPRFQKEILVLRSKWNIPDEGFTIQRKYDEWKNGMIKVDNAKYETEVSNIRNKLGLASRWQEPIKKIRGDEHAPCFQSEAS